MVPFEINFFDHYSRITFNYRIQSSVSPAPIKTRGEISLLPGDGNYRRLGGESSSTLSAASVCQPAVNNTITSGQISPASVSQVASTSRQIALDEIDYDYADITIHVSGKDLQVDINNSIKIRNDITKQLDNVIVVRDGVEKNVVRLSSGEYVCRVGNDQSTDELIDPREAGIVPSHELILNVAPISDINVLMDVDLWYKTKLGRVEVNREMQYFADNVDDEIIRDDRRYIPKTTRAVKRRWWESLFSGNKSSRENIFSLDYDDYTTFVSRLESKLIPMGISLEIKEYRTEEFVYSTNVVDSSVNEVIKNDVNRFISSRPSIFNTNPNDFGITPVDMSVRDVLRRLFDPSDEYDRRDIKSRDIYTNEVSNQVDEIERSPINVGIDEFLVLSSDEYDSTYKDLYSRLAYFAIPVKFGKQDVDTRVCEDGKEVVKKITTDIGTRIVTISFLDTTKLTSFKKLRLDEVSSENAETVSEVLAVPSIIECKIPGMPSDSFLRRKAFDIYGKVSNDVPAVFPSNSSSIDGLHYTVRNKFNFLLNILKHEYGEDRVRLVETLKSIDKTREMVSDDSIMLSWHNYGYACRILILDSDGHTIQSGTEDFNKLILLSKMFINGCKQGQFGESATVVWGAQLNVNPDPFEWEILPAGYEHVDIIKYRDITLQLTDPVDGSRISFRDIEEFIYFISVKYDAYGDSIPDINTEHVISYPINSMRGEFKYFDNNGQAVTVSVGDYIKLENQADESLNGTWQVLSGKWRHADKYIKWKNENPVSFEQLKLYFSLIGDFNSVRSLLSIELVDILGDVDETLDSATYLKTILTSQTGTVNFFDGIPKVNGIENPEQQRLDDAIKITDSTSPSSFYALYDKKIKTPLYEILYSDRSPVSRSIKMLANDDIIESSSGSFDSIEVGDVITGEGIPVDTYVKKILSYNVIQMTNKSLVTLKSECTFSPYRGSTNNNLFGQREIGSPDISRYIVGQYISSVAEFLSDTDREAICDNIKNIILDNINSWKELYTNSSIRYMFDSIQNGPKSEDINFLENEFGLINVQRILDIDVIQKLYTNDPNEIAVSELIYNPDTNQNDEELLNIFEETISIARGARISVLGREKPTIEPLEDDIELKKDLLSRFGGVGSRIDISDF